MAQRPFGQIDELVDAVEEDRADEFFLGGEATVHGAHADVCVVGDIVESGLKSPGGEQIPGSVDDPLAVAGGVPAQRAIRRLVRIHRLPV